MDEAGGGRERGIEQQEDAGTQSAQLVEAPHRESGSAGCRLVACAF